MLNARVTTVTENAMRISCPNNAVAAIYEININNVGYYNI